MFDETKPRTERRWSGAHLAGLIAVVWFLSILLFFVMVAQP